MSVENLSRIIMLADNCGCTVNGERVLCSHPEARDSVGRKPADCTCENLARAMAPHLVEHQWQPIETAPKDETRVLLGRVGVHALHTAFWRGGIWHCGGGFYFNSPSHWMLLPAPPTALSGSQSRGAVE